MTAARSISRYHGLVDALDRRPCHAGGATGDGGRFGAKFTDQAVLLAFETAAEPFLTTAEVHEHVSSTAGVDVDQKTVYQRLQRMCDDGLIGKKDRGPIGRVVGQARPLNSQRRPPRASSAREEVERGETVALEDV